MALVDKLQCQHMSNTTAVYVRVFIDFMLLKKLPWPLCCLESERLFQRAVSFSKPEWIFNLQINFLNLMECSREDFLSSNACVLIWLQPRVIELVLGWSTGAVDWLSFDVKTNEIRVIDFQSNGETASVLSGELRTVYLEMFWHFWRFIGWQMKHTDNQTNMCRRRWTVCVWSTMTTCCVMQLRFMLC